MFTTKTDRQFNHIATFSKNRLTGNATRATQLIIAFLISLLSLIPSTVFAQLFISATSGSSDYVIPANINAISVTVKGGAGGTVSDGSCGAPGGKGVVFTARFKVNNTMCPDVSLESGGVLRAVVGAKGGFNAQDGGAGGGGGSALLYKAPGSNDWIKLIVAGGGGGGATRSLPCQASNGGDGLLGQNGGNGLNGGGSGGSNGNGGLSFLLDAFGGGGESTDGNSIGGNCNGQSGFPAGSAGGDCGSNFTSDGGFGFGSGGSGGLNGGGGGGYSGGGGGGPGAGGGGGGSYFSGWGSLISSGAINTSSGSIQVTGENLAPNFFTKKIYVNKEVVGGNNDGSSWPNAFINLQDALNVASSTSICDAEIWVAKGTYYPDEVNGQNTNNRTSSFKMKSAVKLYGGFAGGETQLSQRNWFSNSTYLSGDLAQNDEAVEDISENAYHVVEAGTPAVFVNGNAVLDGFIVTGGNANGSTTNGYGGGMLNWNTYIMIEHCEFQNNHSQFGGGLANYSDDDFIGTYPSIINCFFRGNSANLGGGAVYNKSSVPYFNNCVFSGNYANLANSGVGGGLYNTDISEAVFVNCTFNGNHSAGAGAIYTGGNSVVKLFNTIIWENAESNSINTPGASVYIVPNSNSSIEYVACLVQNLNLEGSNQNMDGTSLENNPIFTLSVDPSSAPSTSGFLLPLACSPVIDKGDNQYESLEKDIILQTRNINGIVDLGAYEVQVTTQVFYLDGDGDGYGNPNVSEPGCTQLQGYVLNANDCNDNDPAINPATIWYQDADGDLLGNPAVSTNACVAPDGYVANANDCNDNDNQNLGIIYVNKQATGNNDGTSWINAFNKLQDALALNCTGITQIWVAQGAYYPDEMGNQNTDDRHASFIMKNNVAIYGGFIGDETELTQRNWKDNQTYLSGDIDQSGFGFATNSGNSLHVIFNYDNGLNSSALLDGFLIFGGNANLTADPVSSRGGAMYNYKSSPTLRNCVFFDNSSWQGGALVTQVIDQPMTITNSRFLNNQATGQAGGAIFNLGGKNGLLLISNCSFNSNRAAAEGGAIYSTSNNMKIINSEFIWNRAGNGSAIGNSNASPTIINCSFSGNTATTETNPCVILNEGSSFSPSSPIITNCIIWGNGNAIFNDIYSNPVITFSNVEGGYTGNISVDPLFVDAADGDLHLQAGSPSLNTGNDAANTEPFDLDGQTRIVGVIDMGAYEFQTGNSCPANGILYVNKNANGLNNGTSWLNAYTNLQDALANTCPGITQIWVAQGTYYPDESTAGGNTNDRNVSFVMKNNLAIYGGFAGGETQLSDRNWNTNETILSGDIDQNDQPAFINNEGNSYHIIRNSNNGLNNTAVLNGFTISGGNSNGNTDPLKSGAGIYNHNVSPKVINCKFSANNATFYGAGMMNTTGSSPSITDCDFSGNRSATAGAVININSSSPSITNCNFNANTVSGDGGAIGNFTSSAPILTNCIFSGNISGRFGGAIYNSLSNATFNGCKFQLNSAAERGGGVYNTNNSAVVFTSCDFEGNSAAKYGGGVFSINSTPTFTSCKFEENSATEYGGGILDVNSTSTSTGCRFFDNNADYGGACFNQNSPSKYVNCAFSANTATTNGHALYNVLNAKPQVINCSFGNHPVIGTSAVICNEDLSYPVLTNCILWNEAPEIENINTDPALVLITYSIVKQASGEYPGTGNRNINPLFADAANGNLHLQKCSPAINTGLNSANTTTTDLDANTRVVYTTIDMGAYEFQGTVPPIDLVCPSNIAVNTDPGQCNAIVNFTGSNVATTSECATITYSPASGSSFGTGTSAVLVTATDATGNTATCSFTVTVADKTAPVFSGSFTTVTLGCNPSAADINAALGTARATDACGAIVTSNDGSVSGSCYKSQTRTFMATDGGGNTATVARMITWKEDATAPTFTGSYPDVNLGCNPPAPDGSLGTATATDGCGAVTITSSDGAVQSNGCNRSRTRTFTATDGCLNTSTTSRTVRWIADVTSPSFTGSYADMNLGCNPGNPDGSLGTATATDGCGAVTITQSDGAVVTTGCNRSRTRTFTATDGCLNTCTTSRTVKWISDNTPPVFTGTYPDVNLGCNPANPDGSLGTATATDGCGAVTITSSDGAVQSNGCNRSRTRTFTATDGCLNTSTTSRTVRWIYDITPPSFTGYYTDVNLNCNPANPDGSLGTATATDGCGAVTITSSDGAVVSNGCNRSRTRTFTATDGCLNTSTTSRTVRWIYDVTAPALVCAKTGTVTKSTNQGLCTYTVNGIEFNPTASDICSAPSLAWSVSDATNTSGNTTMGGVVLNFGYNTIKWTATDACGNTSTCSFIVNVNKVTTTTLLVVSTTPASNPVTQQYSDKITCVATVTNCPNAGPIGGTVTFKIINAQGTVVLGSAPVASDGTATLTDTLIENQFYPGATNSLPSNGPLKPGNKTVTAVYSDTDPDYIIVTNPTAPVVVTCENADITYNGLNYFGANPNTNQGTITVSAFVLDANDVPAQARGDIRNATVTFKEGTSGGAAIGIANIPVGLVNPTNFQEGIVTTNRMYTLTTQDINCGGKIVDVWAGVNNYYCGEIAEVVPVCLSLPGGDFVTGGGWIKMLNSEGSYAGTDDKKMHAALAFKWNKSNKNLQGNATIVYKRIVNGVQKVYQVKSNSITSMIVNNVNDAGTAVTTGATYRMAQIVTKANFRDLTDPEFPVALFGNLTLTITAWESIATTDGSKDRISVELVGSGSQGLIFSSNWLSGATQWQQLNSGKMRVRNPTAEIPCTNCSGSGITAKPGAVDKTAETIPAIEDLKVTVMPNPSNTNFRITVNSNDLKAPVKLFVTDMLGRVIETRITYAGQTITIGDKYISGTYAVRIMQGRKTKQLTLIKLSD